MHRHHSLLHFLKNQELDELYACVGIKYFAISMIGVFIPIYFITLGFSLAQVFLFYAIVSLFHAFSTLFAAKLSSRFGLKHVILFSLPLLILFYVLLYVLPNLHILFYISPVIYGIQGSLFWTSFHTEFSKASKKKYAGRQVSFRKLLISLFSILGPVFGGFLITFFGFHVLFIVVCALLFGSSFPLFLTNDIHVPFEFSISSIKNILKTRKLKDYLGHIGFGIESCGAVIWPIFIFLLVITNFAGLGLITTISLAFSFLLIFFIGYFSDIHKHYVMRLGSILTSAVWLIKIAAVTPVFAFIIDSVYGLSKPALTIPFDAIAYNESKRGSIINYMIFRESIIHLSRTAFFVFMMLFVGVILSSTMLPNSTVYVASSVGFTFFAIGSLLYFFF